MGNEQSEFLVITRYPVGVPAEVQQPQGYSNSLPMTYIPPTHPVSITNVSIERTLKTK